MERAIIKLTTAILAVLAGILLAAPRAAQAEVVNIAVLHTNDTRGHIQSFYYQSPKPLGGYAKRAIFFQEKRRHGGMHWLTLDAGNALGYSPLSYYLKGYLDVRLMTLLGYDACGLGPLEFIHGQGELAARIGEAGFPFLSANVLDEASGKYLGEPFKIAELGGFRIALLGLTDPGTPSQVPPDYTRGLVFRDPLEVAREWIPQLKSQADTIIVLSTLSLAENIALAVAHPEISVIVAGGHLAELRVPLKVDKTLVVEAGRWGQTVGLLKLTFEGDRSSGYRVRFFDEQLEEMGGSWAENTDYLKEIAGQQANLKERFDTVIGSLGMDMPAVKVNSFEANLGNLFADAVREATGAEVVALDAGGFREGLKAGPLTVSDLYRAYPGESRVVVGTMTGEALAALLSQGASNVGRDGFLQVSGVSFGIYDCNAYGITAGGSPLDLAGEYKVAVTERMLEGTEGLTAVFGLRAPELYPYLVREIVESFLAEHSGYANELQERISYFAEPPVTEPAAEPPAAAEPEEGTEGEPVGGELVAEDEAAEEPPALEEAAPEEAAPGEYEVVAEEEVDVGLAPPPAETAGAPPPQDAAAAASAPAGLEVTRSASVGSTSVEADGMVYDFSLDEVVVEGALAFEFTLTLRNTGEAHQMLSFPTGKYYDFKVYKEDKLLWNYGYNRYYTQEAGSLTLPPGAEVTYRAYWDGTGNSRVPLQENLYRFVAEVAATPVQEVSFIALYTPPVF